MLIPLKHPPLLLHWIGFRAESGNRNTELGGAEGQALEMRWRNVRN